jgi:hypothetical protein
MRPFDKRIVRRILKIFEFWAILLSFAIDKASQYVLILSGD